MADGKNRVRYDIDEVRRAAAKRWPEILSQVGGIPRDILNRNHHPCPKCGGTDRFRLMDESVGAVICNQCFSSRNGDGFAAVQWSLGCSFGDALRKIAEHLAVKPAPRNGHSAKPDPARDLEFRPWNETLVALWCLQKPGIKPHAIQQVGGRLATYLGRHTVIALPVWGPQLKKAKPVGWVVFAVNGGKLPVFSDGKPVEWVKMKSTRGTEPGVIGVIRDGKQAWKTEGPSDVLSLISLADFPPDVSAICNVMGAKEDPAKTPWIAKLFDGKDTGCIHDCDDPGQQGAMGWKRPDGTLRPGWCQSLAAEAASCRNVVLPFPIMPDHGKDLRDWTATGGTYGALLELFGRAAIIEKPKAEIVKPIEADNDPHRLARVNLDRFYRLSNGGELRYWQGEWYKWSAARGCYRLIPSDELRVRVGNSIKAEFDRISINKQSEGDKDCTAMRVTPGLVTAVMEAMAGHCVIASSIKINSWMIDRETCDTSKRFVAMKNGLLDLEWYMSEQDGYLIKHSPNWFSTVCLPYEFDDSAECPKWKEFLNYSMGGDVSRIAILQEWAGYLLTASTNRQKMIFFEGEGGNGKSVYMAAIEAMLGVENCSHLGLEMFGQPFMAAQMIGKLLNISSECSEMDSVCEGVLKAMASGDRMTINRKGIVPIEVTPTARIMVSTNVRPRFSDKSSGLWRRMILVPWKVKVPESKIVEGMDKVEWWEASGELPGIFNWAIAGLYRLNQQGKFTKSDICERALNDYRSDMNPTKVFLDETCSQADYERQFISCKSLYDLYKEWSIENGHRPVSDRSFGREVHRQFPKTERKRIRTSEDREYIYTYLMYGGSDESIEVQDLQVTNNQKEFEYV